MLEELSIKDFALIDNATVEFENGFTVLSGETGAGKSLLIGALTFLLGGKSGADLIRTGAHEAVVTGSFYIEPAQRKIDESSISEKSDDDEEYEPKTAYEWLAMHGISVEDDRVLLRRYIRETGKSGAYIGDTPVTRSDLASFSSFLVDIHGQHEHQSLMKVSEHRKFLDAYAGLEGEVENFTKLYSTLVAKRKKLSELDTNAADREKRIELLSFAVEEIENAKLKQNEDDELSDEENRLSSFEKLFGEMEAINSVFDGSSSGEGMGVISALKKIRGSADTVSGIDKTLEPLSQRLENAFFELSDIADEYRSYTQGLAFDPERLAFVQERLALIYNLKKKYAPSVSSPLQEVFKYAENAKNELENMSIGEEGKAALQKEISDLEKSVYQAAKVLSQKRKVSSEKMAAEVASVLASLGMKGTRFVVSVTEKSGENGHQTMNPYGMDNVEFLISANAGLPLGALDKIASGGELSRVMLALKTVLSETDTVSTLIFDEIDTGIGGEIAVSVGSHLKNLASRKQILCITHLASIAVYADSQIKIEKGVENGLTRTKVYGIEGENRVREIARMLSGDAESGESLEHAKMMLEKYSK